MSATFTGISSSQPWIVSEDGDEIKSETSFFVARIMRDGTTDVYATGRYIDVLAVNGGAPKIRERIVICDSSRFDTLAGVAAMSGTETTIALTIGDPNGIGPEIAVKAASEMRGNADIRVILVGDEHVIRHYAAVTRAGCGWSRLPAVCQIIATASCSIRSTPCPPRASSRAMIEPDAGRATVAYVDAAIGLVRKGIADAIVGCPHNETAVNAAGVPFSGYPGLIARLTGTPEEKVFMMLVGGGLRILHATLHERIYHALARLTPDLIEEAGLRLREHVEAARRRESPDRHFRHQSARRRERPVRR